MKKVLSLALLLITTTTIFSQEFSEKLTGRLDYYVGKLGNDELYVTKRLASKESQLVTFENGSFDQKIMYEQGVFSSYKYWFINGDTLNAVILTKEEGTLVVVLQKYSKEYIPAEKITLFRDERIDFSKTDVLCKKSGNQLGIVGASGKRGDHGFAAVMDLGNGEVYSQVFEAEDMSRIGCRDIAINENGDLLAVFEGDENLRTTAPKRKEKKLLAYLLSCTKEKATIAPLNSLHDKEFIRSFRFCTIGVDRTVLGALSFSVSSKNMTGYWLADVEFSQAVANGKLIAATQIDNPDLWQKKDGKRVARGKAHVSLGYQFLKEIRSLSDGSFLFFSEVNYTPPSPPTTSTTMTPGYGTGGAMPGTPGYGQPVFTTTYNSNYWYVNSPSVRDIMVSRISPSGGSVLWTNKTRSRTDDVIQYLQSDMDRGCYTVDLNEETGKLRIYYPEQKKNFEEDGSLKMKCSQPILLGHITAAVLELQLADGKGGSKAVFPDFKNMPDEIVLPACSHVSESGKIIIVTAQDVTKRHYRKLTY